LIVPDGGAEQIVILGAGIGGLRVALRLERILKSELGQIVLIDENSYHQYLYRSHETSGLDFDENDIIMPTSGLISGKDIEFMKMKAESIACAPNVVVRA